MHAGSHGKTAEKIDIMMKIKTAVRNCSTSKATGTAKAVETVITRNAFQCHTRKYMDLMSTETPKYTLPPPPSPLVVTSLCCCTGDKHSYYANKR